MGLCVSCDAAADAVATARVVLPSGELREYTQPATAAMALEEVGHGQQGWLLCDADAMGFQGSVAAVAGADELRPGQIYFVLPAEMLRRSLTLEEVAALAVKASAALVKAATASSAGGRRRRGSVAPLVFAPSEEDYSDDSLMTCAAAKPAVSRKRVVAYRAGKSPPRVLSRLDRHPGERVDRTASRYSQKKRHLEHHLAALAFDVPAAPVGGGQRRDIIGKSLNLGRNSGVFC